MQVAVALYFTAAHCGNRGVIPWSRAAHDLAEWFKLAPIPLGFAALICIGRSDLDENRRSAALIASFIAGVASVALMPPSII